jgi:Spy/CpxP family protein refolding chaperone
MLGLPGRNDPDQERSFAMRRFIVILGLIAFVAAGTALAGSGGKRQELGNKVQAELNKIDARLKLNPDQKTQIKTLLGEQSDKLDALYAEIEPRETAIKTEYRGKIRQVLTAEQQAEWDKIKGEYKEKWSGKKAMNTSKTSTKTTTTTTSDATK